MSNMRKVLELDRHGIDRINDLETAKEFLRVLVDQIEEFWKVLYDNIENGMMTKDWRIRQVGDHLELQHFESGSWVNRGFKYKGS